jgi:hypothetical protein
MSGSIMVIMVKKWRYLTEIDPCFFIVSEVFASLGLYGCLSPTKYSALRFLILILHPYRQTNELEEDAM